MSEENQGWRPRTGDDGMDHAKKLEEQRKASYVPFRFFLQRGASAKFTFLDSAGFYFMEHTLRLGPKKFVQYTCPAEYTECPLCDSGEKPSYVCAYTIIDHSVYKDKDGNERRNLKRLLVVKPKVMEILARRKKTEMLAGDLTLALFESTRDNQETSCGTGEDIQFLKRLTKEELAKLMPKDLKGADGKTPMTLDEWLAPYDYMKIFAPRPVEELRRAVGASAPVGADDHGQSHGAPRPARSTASEESIEDLL